MRLVKCPQCGRNVDTDEEEIVWCEFTRQDLCEDCVQENVDEAEEMEEDLEKHSYEPFHWLQNDEFEE